MGEEPEDPVRDWRDEAAYERLKQLDRRGFAWEYLRRNHKFRREQRLRCLPEEEKRDGLKIIRVERDNVFDHWGLLFRRCMVRFSPHDESLLA